MKRALAILSEGMLSDSQRRTLTFLSQGMLVLSIAPIDVATLRRRRRRGTGKIIDDSLLKRLIQDDEDVLSIIYTFIECQG